ncbi:MAG: tRNA lysidine(34) synthetase TilS [Mongoliitalea sp.]
MLEDFISHIRSKNLLDSQKRYLLAISGGVDSVALGHLLHQAGYHFDLATVNFNLRGEHSKADFAFVEALAKEWKVQFHGKTIAPDLWESLTGESIQMKARSLRYEWLEELKLAHGYEGILVAHHFEDQLETILLNLLRGCGIDGITGMAERRGVIIRPLLSFRKDALIQFMKTQGYPWREDISNQKDVYQRNFIRHQVLSKIENTFPSGLEVMAESFGRIKDTGKAFHYFFERWKADAVIREGDFQILKINSFQSVPGKHSLLFYWLRDFGFSSAVVEDILQAVEDAHVGKLFHSYNHTLNLDRNSLIVGPKEREFLAKEVVATDVELYLEDEIYDILRIEKDSFVDKSPENAMMDASRLQFPLKVRNWELGDRFIPLGMNKEKKISDFLVDLKIPMIQKRRVKVMLSGEKIIWVIGFRISDSVKIQEQTQAIVYFKKK